MENNPWGRQPRNISGATFDEARMESCDYVRDVLDKAKVLGCIPEEPPPGIHIHVDVRCSYQTAGTFQHVRDAWHTDNAFLNYIYIEGESPTEVRRGGKTWAVEPATWTAYHQLEHRCPPQKNAGWRLFLRVLWCCEAPHLYITK